MSELRLDRLNSILNPPLPHTDSSSVKSNSKSFSDILSQEIENDSGLKFSKHAQLRLESRNITLVQDDLERLNGAVQKVSEKGVGDSLVLMDNLAFIVNVPNKTVVTAMMTSEAKENVFTNIDGAVII